MMLCACPEPLLPIVTLEYPVFTVTLCTWSVFVNWVFLFMPCAVPYAFLTAPGGEP